MTFYSLRRSYHHLGIYFSDEDKERIATIIDVHLSADFIPDGTEVLVFSQEYAYSASEEDIIECVRLFRRSAKEHFDAERKADEIKHHMNQLGIGKEHPIRSRPPSELQRLMAHKDFRPGYVYAVRAETPDGPAYKIGKTVRKPDKRTAEFIPMLPYAARLVWHAAVFDIDTVESALHKYYENRRLRGEWFVLSPGNLELLDALAKAYDTTIDD